MASLSFNPAFETIEAFTRNVRPTQTSSRDATWLTVRHAPQPLVDPIRPGLTEQYNEILDYCQQKCLLAPRRKKHFREEAKTRLLELAALHGDVKGKWILFPFKERVDEIWAQIAQMTYEGKLGHYSKVATGDQRLYATCVYTDNFVDREKVKSILRGLQGVGIVKRWTEDPDEQRMGASFKPDVFTRLGLYHHNPGELKIDPVIYRVDDFLE